MNILENIKNEFLLILNNSKAFTTIIIGDFFYTIESSFSDDDIIVKEYNSEEEYEELDGEVKDEDTDIMYIDCKGLYKKIYNQEGELKKDNILEKEDIKQEITDKAYFMIDFFGIK